MILINGILPFNKLKKKKTKKSKKMENIYPKLKRKNVIPRPARLIYGKVGDTYLYVSPAENEIAKFSLLKNDDLPTDSGSLFKGFNNRHFDGIRTENFNLAYKMLDKGFRIGLYLCNQSDKQSLLLAEFLTYVRNTRGSVNCYFYDNKKKEWQKRTF